MKKTFLAAMFLLLGSSAWAQTEIGIKLSGSLASNRVTALSSYGLEKEGVQPRFGLGLVIDYFFGENYAFGTGLMFNNKGGSIRYRIPDTNIIEKDEFNIQYLELPVTMKLFTNEIATDTRLYFQLGGSLNTKISGKVDGDKVDAANQRTAKRFNPFEIGALAGAGVEWQLGQNTKVFGGITYHRGLTDIDKYYEKLFNDKGISIKNSSVSLDVGLKF